MYVKREISRLDYENGNVEYLPHWVWSWSESLQALIAVNARCKANEMPVLL